MQDSLFPEDELPAPGPADPARPADGATPAAPADSAAPGNAAAASTSASAPAPVPAKRRPAVDAVLPLPPDRADLQLRDRLPPRLRLGTSSWNYPGWAGLVWNDAYAEATLSRRGLPALAQHPLFRTVSLDRAFYRPLTVAQYADYAAQVPHDFRFVVKAPAAVTDALVRHEDGRGMQANPSFLDPALALDALVAPALEGLGPKLGALVFQLSPLPVTLRRNLPRVIARLEALLAAIPLLAPQAPDAVVAVEVRDPDWIAAPHRAAFVAALKGTGATFCLGLHAKMPPIDDQLQMLRDLWPGPLVCRWNLNPLNGRYGYEDAEVRYAPFDRILDPDLHTRTMLAKVAGATARAGHAAYVTVSNHAEGSAPHSIRLLATEIAQGPA
nr:DUF72 domain-containing protein [uncultured Xylophilus sp.]